MLTLPHYVHIAGFILLFCVVLVRSSTIFTTTDEQPSQKNRKLFVACQHSALTLIGVTGIYLMYQKGFVVQPWFYAKIMLFAVMLSCLIKAFKKPSPSITLTQRKAGLTIALFCYLSILILVFLTD